MPPTFPQSGTEQAQDSPTSSPLSVFLIISAKAYSSVGFGLSVLAIWMRWLLPENLAATAAAQVVIASPPKLPKPRSKLRSFPKTPRIPPPTPVRRSSAPPDTSIPPISILEHPDHPASSHRRVYFADTQPRAIRRNTAPLERPTPVSDEIHRPPSPIPEAITFTPVLIESPPPSDQLLTNSTIVTTPTDDIPATTNDDHENDKTTTTPSSTPRQRKLRLSFNLINKRTTTEKSREDTVVQETIVKPSKKTNHTFVPPWTSSRKSSTSPEGSINSEAGSSKPSSSFFHKPSTPTSTSSKSSSSCSSVGSLPSLILSKKARRTSAPAPAPTPRTLPYEAPYFATPPLILDDSYSRYLRHLPQFEDDMTTRSSTSTHTRASDARPASSDGIINNVERSPHKRRSASVNWVPRTAPTVLQ